MPNLALVGCAHIHTPGFIKKINERKVKVSRVWDHDAARAQRRAGELSATVAADLRAIVDDAAIDAVVVCSETHLHQELVQALAPAGKHLFVEKPLGMRSDDAYAMAGAIERGGGIFQTGYFMRGSAIHLWLKQQMQAGLFGRLTRIRGSNCHAGAIKGWFDTEWRWMADPKLAGCGAFGDLGTHSLDLMLWLAGDVAAATATINDGTRRYGDCDEAGEGLFRFKNGAVGTLAAGWIDIANPASLIISGTEAHAAVINGQLFVVSEKLKADGKSPWTDLPPAQSAGFDAFLDAVEHKSAALVTVREAAYRSAVMEALYTGGREQRWTAPRES